MVPARRSLSRTLALWLMCASFLLGTLGEPVHHALVTHVLCVEHGTVEHGLSAGHHHDQDGPTISAPDDEEHEACGVTAVLTDRPTLPELVSGPAFADADPPTARIHTTGAPRGPPLAYAPKTSPPVTA